MTAASITDEQFALYQRTVSALGIGDFSSLLVHYTSVATLEAILHSRELWFGRLSDLKDTAECDHFIDGVLQNASSLVPIADPNVIAATARHFRQAVRNETCVSSWCEYSLAEPEGKLGMWREFGDDGAGVGIVIDSSQFLASAIKREHLSFGIYSARMEYVHKDRVSDHANDMFKRVANIAMPGTDVMRKLMVAALVLGKAPCVKCHSYREEQEIRFMRMSPTLNGGIAGPTVQRFATVRGKQRAFAALPLKDYPQNSLDLRVERILKRVVVGPKGDRAAREQRVKALLAKHGLGHMPVVVSDIPWRGDEAA
jgi:hypothetical protein